MELWIRSQDKERLVHIEHAISIGGNKADKYFIWYHSELLGKYKSKKRALEVLDEIQKILQPQMVLSKVGKPIAKTCDGLVYTEPNEYEIKELSTYVYEMPEE